VRTLVKPERALGLEPRSVDLVPRQARRDAWNVIERLQTRQRAQRQQRLDLR
jgi:hypothetical protein